MYPFINKEISRQKNVRIQVGVDVKANLPKYDSQNKLSYVIQVAVPKGEYVVDKVFTEQFNKYGAKESTGKKDFYYDIKIPIQTSNTSAPLTSFSLSPSSDIKELTSVTEQNGLGINNLNSKDVAPQTFLEKNKTNLLIVGVLVLGYFAYKKFKK
jgi:hypothetical protein